MPRQLVSMLRDLSEDLGRLGEHAAAQAAETRTTALTITLEAVKAGVPPGKLRDAAQRLRQDAAKHAEKVAYERAKMTLRVGQAIARASTLAREADLLEPTRQRAAMLAGALWQASREVKHSNGHTPAMLSSLHPRPGRLSRARAVRMQGGPAIEVPVDGRIWVGALKWRGPLQNAWLGGDVMAFTLALAGHPSVSIARHLDVAAPRVWLVAGSHAIASSHAEEVPQVSPPEGLDSGVVEVGRRRVAVARLPPLVDGLQDWHVVATPAPRLREARRPSAGRGEVIQFPGMR